MNRLAAVSVAASAVAVIGAGCAQTSGQRVNGTGERAVSAAQLDGQPDAQLRLLTTNPLCDTVVQPNPAGNLARMKDVLFTEYDELGPIIELRNWGRSSGTVARQFQVVDAQGVKWTSERVTLAARPTQGAGKSVRIEVEHLDDQSQWPAIRIFDEKGTGSRPVEWTGSNGQTAKQVRSIRDTALSDDQTSVAQVRPTVTRDGAQTHDEFHVEARAHAVRIRIQ